jgi:hypothetical protein
MKISKEVIEKYQELCPLSSMKCESRFDIEYKIMRAIHLGKQTEILDHGDTLVIRYHFNNFYIHKNKVVDMKKDFSKNEFFVSRTEKDKYDKIHSMLVV